MGTPDFAIPSLKILLDNNYDIPAVVTVPDRPKGRGRTVSASPIKEFAERHNIPILQPVSLRDPEFISQLKSIDAELFVVVAFRILPREVFTLPLKGSFNLHASLLPRYRGAAPINWAIIKGEKETGVTTFFLRDRVDTGDVILRARTPIGPDDNFGTLYTKLSEIGASIVLHTCRLIESGKAIGLPQDESLATPAPKIFKDDCRIDWTEPAPAIHDFVRGLSPIPCAFTSYQQRTFRIFRTQLTNEPTLAPPGTILLTERKLRVATGNGLLEILELQPESKRRMTAEEFLRGAIFLQSASFS